MKKIFFAIAMLAAGICSAYAEDEATFTISTDKQSVVKGENLTLTITLQTNFNADAYQLDVTLQNGLAIPTFEEEGVIYPDLSSSVSALELKTQFVNANNTTFRVLGEPKRATSKISSTLNAVVTILEIEINTTYATVGTNTISLGGDIVITNCNDKLAKYSVSPSVSLNTSFEVTAPTYYLAGDAAIMPATDPAALIIDDNGLSFIGVDNLTAGSYNYKVTIGTGADAIEYATGDPLVIANNGKYDITYVFNEANATITAYSTFVDWATGCEQVDAATAEKRLIDGNVVIRSNNADYTVLGQKL